jgi:hypothetical protein
MDGWIGVIRKGNGEKKRGLTVNLPPSTLGRQGSLPRFMSKVAVQRPAMGVPVCGFLDRMGWVGECGGCGGCGGWEGWKGGGCDS